MAIHASAEFDYDLDDLVDVAWRNVQWSRHSQLRYAANVFGVLAGVGLGWAALSLVPENRWIAVPVGLAAAVVFAIAYFHRLCANIRRSLHRTLREQQGEGLRRCIVELHDDHMLWRQPDLDMRLAWRDVRAIEPDGDDLVVLSRSGVSLLRGRAFANPEARERFVTTALLLQNAAATPVS